MAPPPEHLGVSDGKQCSIQYSPGHFFFKDDSPALKPKIPSVLKDSAKDKFGGKKPSKRGGLSSILASQSPNWSTHRINSKRAGVLADNIGARKFGALPYSPEDIQKMKSCCDRPSIRTVEILGIFGVPGAGKTYKLLQEIKSTMLAYPDEDFFRFVSPTTLLRDAAKADLNLSQGEGYKAPTLETPFTGSYTELMILDEISRYPPGYVDLLLLLCPGITHIIFTGDPNQSTYHCPHPDNTFSKVSDEIDYLAQYCAIYLQESRRFSAPLANALGIPNIDNGLNGTLNLDGSIHGDQQMLVPSEVNNKELIALGRKSCTWSGSQGLTYKTSGGVQVIVDPHAVYADDRAWFTVLTRSSTHVTIIRLAGKQTSMMTSAIGRAIMAKDVTALRKAVLAHMATHTPPKFLNGLKFAGGDDDASERFPHLSGIIPDYPYPSFESLVAPNAPHPPELLANPHYQSLLDHTLENGKSIHISRQSFRSNIIDSLLPLVDVALRLCRISDDREKLWRGTYTTQVNDTNDLTSIFVKHSRGDTATERWTATERYLKFVEEDVSPKTAIGIHLHLRYREAFRSTIEPFDDQAWEDAIEYDRNNYLSKGEKAINSIAERADPHWAPNWAERFMKAQSVTKPETEGRDAKKGAEIYSFATVTNFEFGPLARYMTVKVAAETPDHVFTLNEKTDADLSDIVREKMDFSIETRESDYEGFDKTQGFEFVARDLLQMADKGIPAHVRDRYLEFISTIHTYGGRMGYMMATGFKFTLIFNTERSKAYQATKFVLLWGYLFGGTGDDVIHNQPTIYQPDWGLIEPHLKLIAIEKWSKYPVLCGWLCLPTGCIKSPTLLFHRTAYRIATSEDNSFAYGYMADCTPLHQNFALHEPYLTPEQVDAHFTTVDLLSLVANHGGLALFGNFVVRFGLSRSFSLL